MLIKHLNHASVLLTDRSGFSILVDPWAISPSFGGWVTSPSPFYSDILDLIRKTSENLCIVVSHGHDDHCDEFLLGSSPFAQCTKYIPKFKSPGLKNRLSRISSFETCIVEVDTYPVSVGDFSIFTVINTSLGCDDAHVIIYDSENCIILSNDNWHPFEPNVLSDILRPIGHIDSSNRFYLVQYGIADAFPYTYTMRKQQMKQLATRRYQNYALSI